MKEAMMRAAQEQQPVGPVVSARGAHQHMMHLEERDGAATRDTAPAAVPPDHGPAHRRRDRRRGARRATASAKPTLAMAAAALWALAGCAVYTRPTPDMLSGRAPVSAERARFLAFETRAETRNVTRVALAMCVLALTVDATALVLGLTGDLSVDGTLALSVVSLPPTAVCATYYFSTLRGAAIADAWEELARRAAATSPPASLPAP